MTSHVLEKKDTVEMYVKNKSWKDLENTTLEQ